jgi:hypothetical protein
LSRKFTIAEESWPSGMSVSYVKAVRNQSWSATIRSKFVDSPAVTSWAVWAITGGRSSGKARYIASGGSSDVAPCSASAVNRGIAEPNSNVSPSSRSFSVLINADESPTNDMPPSSVRIAALTGSGATGTSGPSSALMTSSWSFCTAAGDRGGRVSPSPSTSLSATSQRLPSKRGSAEIRQ